MAQGGAAGGQRLSKEWSTRLSRWALGQGRNQSNVIEWLGVS
jgi:hypothetical protein